MKLRKLNINDNKKRLQTTLKQKTRIIKCNRKNRKIKVFTKILAKTIKCKKMKEMIKKKVNSDHWNEKMIK